MNDLNLLRQNAKEHYQKIDNLYCPYFQEEVFFTSEGFNHIRYRKARNERHYSVQKMRYKILPLAFEVIKNSKTLQEHDIQSSFVEVKYNKRREKVMKEICFFGFIAIIRGWKVKIIVRQVGEGKKHFWSIIPNWKTRRTKDGRMNLRYTGNLAID